jgi:hypothetical protein
VGKHLINAPLRGSLPAGHGDGNKIVDLEIFESGRLQNLVPLVFDILFTI